MIAIARAPIPVTVIGGFLGAGKTTCLNRLLRSGTRPLCRAGQRFRRDEHRCRPDRTARRHHDDADQWLRVLQHRCGLPRDAWPNARRGDPFDRIVIEASGVGDPWRIAEIALVEPSLRLDAVICPCGCIADRALLVDDPRVGDTVRNQFDRCNLVLLNKSDLLDRCCDCRPHVDALGIRPR